MWNRGWNCSTKARPPCRQDLPMTVTKAEVLPIRNSTDVVLARQAVRRWAIEAKFTLVDQTKLITAASELARNTLDHGHGGQMTVETVVGNNGRTGLKLVF